MKTKATVTRKPPHIYIHITAGSQPAHTQMDAEAALEEASAVNDCDFEINVTQTEEKGRPVIIGSLFLKGAVTRAQYTTAVEKVRDECETWFDETHVKEEESSYAFVIPADQAD